MLKPAFRRRLQAAVRRPGARDRDGGPAIIVGTPWRQDGKLYNAASAARRRRDRGAALQARSAELRRLRREARLRRRPGARADRVPRRAPRRPGLRGHVDAGCRPRPWRNRRRDAARHQRLALRADKQTSASRSPCARVKETGLPLLYVNQVGGQDELVFDGASFALDADVRSASQLPAWDEAVVLTRLAARRRRRLASATRATTPADEGARRRSIRRWCWACATM